MISAIDDGRHWAPRALALAVVALLATGLASLDMIRSDDDGLRASAGASLGARSLALPIPDQNLAALPPAPYSSTTPTEPPPPTVAPSPTETAVARPPSSETAPTTAAPPVTATPPTTLAATLPSGGAPAQTFIVTVVSEFEAAVQLKINDQSFEVAPGQTIGPFTIEAAPSGNDSLEIRRSDAPMCGLGDAGGLFQPGKRFRVTVVTAGGTGCGGAAAGLKSPYFRITTL